MFHGRGPNKAVNPYVLRDMYESYIQDKEKESPYHIPYSLYVELCTEFYKGIAEYIKNGGLYIMPYRMGDISVVKIRPKKLDLTSMSLDWKATSELGKQVFHTNDHTNYHKFRFHWKKKDAYFSNKGKYRLVFTRDNKRDLARLIKTGDVTYFELD
jgi:hypothetical protein